MEKTLAFNYVDYVQLCNNTTYINLCQTQCNKSLVVAFGLIKLDTILICKHGADLFTHYTLLCDVIIHTQQLSYQ